MAKRTRACPLVGSAAFAAWALASYLCLFLGCVNVLVPTYVGLPPDGVGRYLYFSTHRYIGEALRVIFWPCVWALEGSGLFLYATRSAPDFYASAGPILRRLGAPTGWEYFWAQSHPLAWWAVRALVLAEAVTTAVLVLMVIRWLRGIRTSALASGEGAERDQGEKENGRNGGKEG